MRKANRVARDAVDVAALGLPPDDLERSTVMTMWLRRPDVVRPMRLDGRATNRQQNHLNPRIPPGGEA